MPKSKFRLRENRLFGAASGKQAKPPILAKTEESEKKAKRAFCFLRESIFLSVAGKTIPSVLLSDIRHDILLFKNPFVRPAKYTLQGEKMRFVGSLQPCPSGLNRDCRIFLRQTIYRFQPNDFPFG